MAELSDEWRASDDGDWMPGVMEHAEQARPKDSDSAGRFRPNRQSSVQLTTFDQLTHALSYGRLEGMPALSADETCIGIPFHGLVCTGCNPAEPKSWQAGVWLVVVKGARLRHIFDHLAEERRQSIHSTGSVDGDKPLVESITLTLIGK